MPAMVASAGWGSSVWRGGARRAPGPSPAVSWSPSRLGESRGQGVDLAPAVHLGHAEEHARLIVGRDIDAADDRPLPESGVEPGNRPRAADDELLEERLFRIHQPVAGQRRDGLRRVVRFLVAEAGDLAEAGLTQAAEVDRD